MAKTITLDGVQIAQVRLAKDMAGNIHIFCEYYITAGGRVIETRHRDITFEEAAQVAAAVALFAAIAQDVTTAELT